MVAICRICKTTFLSCEFCFNPDCDKHYCKTCYYELNKERKKEYQNQYWKNNPDKYKINLERAKERLEKDPIAKEANRIRARKRYWDKKLSLP